MYHKERKYQFRQRLMSVHPTDIRDPERAVSKVELEITDAFSVILPATPREVILRAAKDFQDFLLTAMNVSIRVRKREVCDGSPTVCITLDDTMNVGSFQIDTAEGINIRAHDERAAAQAFYYLEDRMCQCKGPYLKKGTVTQKALFSPRMVHSGYGLDQYPNEHLNTIAHAGMDAILVFVKGINTTPSGFLDFNDLIYRASCYGIDVYAYSYLKSEMHPEEEGAQAFYDQVYGSLFAACPGLKGIVLVGESVGFPSNDPHVAPKNQVASEDGIPHGKPRPGWWPCEDYPQWLECIKKAIRTQKADADIVFWTYNWGYVDEQARMELIAKLPTDISLMATYEMFESYRGEGFMQTCADYSLAFAGPGNYFTSEAKAAAKRGIRMYAMANTGGLTWDIGTIPYQPMPYQWIERYRGLREANEKYGLCGLMESHHFGFYPSFISDLAKLCFAAENRDMEENLSWVIRMHFGIKEEEKIARALRLWSDAIRLYTPSDADQYGAFRLGPAYPLCLIKEIKPPSEDFAHFGTAIAEVIYPADYSPTNKIPCGRGMLPSLRIPGELISLGKMLDHMRLGVAILKSISQPNEELLRLINLGEYICCCVQTGIHAKHWYVLTSQLKAALDRDTVRQLLQQIKTLIDAEYANAECAIPLVEKDSRLGWEPSMDYVADAEHIRWKLRHLEYVRRYELKCYLDGSDDKWFSA